ncbi:hypothetical protein TRP8649_00505 [Pelagimonas phthalicica]|uniref:Uncharacterized protein n=1 Tax=Pelagimonas phthalicica TaxID=1037362 RepID=A0A238J982_9RHOB|nr:hypothetical protein [Pelagimonas phthalicica]TDS95048.1 hypothetical protein CLV87_1567 [Pelagimonas phthalicica]SMX26426.1 hypothetical protein TRP8649_00505 [Pelagimonas phthalicica]
MEQAWAEGEALVRWNVAALQSRAYPGSARPMPDVVDYRFENGWTATGDLPCREALRAEIAARSVDLPELSFDEVYLGGDGGDVDFSTFCHLPEWRVRHARVTLSSATEQVLRLNVVTAGAVHIWRGADLVHRFEPFSRNEKQHSEFEMHVQAGDQPLTVRFEDLHERDTIFGFRLQLLQGQGLSTRIACDAQPTEIAEATALLEGLRTLEVFHETSKVSVTSDALSQTPFELVCLDLDDQGGRLSRDHPSFDITLPTGCFGLRFGIALGGTMLTAGVGSTVLTGMGRLDQSCFETRKTALLQNQQSGDDIVNVLLALSQGEWNTSVQAIFNESLKQVEQRYDCADFRMMSLLWIWDRLRSRLPAGHADRLRNAILGFRYWMDTPGDDVMWFWSENHVLCFHIAEHLAGQMLPDAIFGNSGLRGTDHRDQGATRLHRWFDAIDEHGLAEWNSAAYYPINYRGLLALYTLSQDEDLRGRAKTLLDRISLMVALHATGGVSAGTQGRIYEKELLAGPMTELGAIASLMFGGWHVPGKDAAAVMLALSEYRPPERLTGLAHPKPGTVLRAQYVQGLEGGAHLALFKTPAVQLSSVVQHKAGQAGHQQHVLDVQFASDPMARLWINHPGVLRPWAEARPSFWAGNGRLPELVQQDETAVLRYELRDGDIGFTHLFLPVDRLDEVEISDHWVFARAGAGFAAIWSAGVLEQQKTGLYAGYELRQAGPVCGWAVMVGDSGQCDFNSFKEHARAMSPRLGAGDITITTNVGIWGTGSACPVPSSTIPKIEERQMPKGRWTIQQGSRS